MHPFHFIVILDRDQAGQTLFLRSLARGAAKHRGIRGIYVHTDNERTDLLLQQGIMREDARKRVIKETNRRLVDVFADSGVGAVGMQWHQIGSIDNSGSVIFRNDPRTLIPHSTQLIMSNMYDEVGSVIDLEQLASALSKTLSLPLLKINAARMDGIFVQKEPRVDTSADVSTHNGYGDVQHVNIEIWNTLGDYIFCE